MRKSSHGQGERGYHQAGGAKPSVDGSIEYTSTPNQPRLVTESEGNYLTVTSDADYDEAVASEPDDELYEDVNPSYDKANGSATYYDSPVPTSRQSILTPIVDSKQKNSPKQARKSSTQGENIRLQVEVEVKLTNKWEKKVVALTDSHVLIRHQISKLIELQVPVAGIQTFIQTDPATILLKSSVVPTIYVKFLNKDIASSWQMNVDLIGKLALVHEAPPPNEPAPSVPVTPAPAATAVVGTGSTASSSPLSGRKQAPPRPPPPKTRPPPPPTSNGGSLGGVTLATNGGSLGGVNPTITQEDEGSVKPTAPTPITAKPTAPTPIPAKPVAPPRPQRLKPTKQPDRPTTPNMESPGDQGPVELPAEEREGTCAECRKSLAGLRFLDYTPTIRICETCYRLKYAPSCVSCQKVIEEGERNVKYKEKAYHVDCFICSACKKPLGANFFDKETGFFCHTCHDSTFLPKCRSCNSVIKGQHCIFKEAPYHSDCFNCVVCGRQLSDSKLADFDGNPAHADCYAVKKGYICYRCDVAISGQGKFVSFEKKCWHADCFTCQHCDLPLQGEGFIFRGDGISCGECAQEYA